MRKTIILILCMILSCSMSACQAAKPNVEDMTTGQFHEQTTDKTENTAENVTTDVKGDVIPDTTETEPSNAENEYQFCIAPAEYAEVEQYLQAMWEKKYRESDGISPNSVQQISLMVPVAKGNLRLLRIENYYADVRYFFCPIGEEPIESGPERNVIEVEYLLSPTAYEYFVESPEYQFDPQNDAIDYWGHWLLGIQGYVFEVWFQRAYGVPTVPLDEVYEMFEFQLVTYSPTAETNATQ